MSVFVIASLLFMPVDIEYVIYCVLLIAIMLSGYLDDAAKTPWNEYKKGAIDLVLSIMTMWNFVNYNSTEIHIGSMSVDIPVPVYFVLGIILLWVSINVTNCTDGVDGLDASITFFACVAYMLIASMLDYLGVTAMSAAAAGACLGFLVWNFHPAKVFMGDTGSLFLGGLVVALAFAIDMPILLLLIGFVYIAEEVSVVLQVSYFKITHGKRLFKMSPIHHHFEMCGWSEVKIVAVFSAVTAVFGAIAFALVYFGV